MKNPTVSVVIIAYNEEEYIAKTLDSLMKQTIKPEEIIVVDNNSEDRTAEIASKYKGVRVVSEKEQGMSPARNRGFNEARSKILVKLDADTVLEEDFIRNLKEVFLREKKAVAIIPYVLYPLCIWDISFRLTIISYLTEILLGSKTCSGGSYVLTKEAWEKVRGNICNDDKKVHEDTEISLHLDNIGKVVYAKDCKSVTSSRRIRERPQVLIEYSIRFLKQYWYNRGLLRRFRIFWGHRSPYRGVED